MTTDQAKFLTEFLGECWHEPASNLSRYCHKCGHTIPKDSQTGNIIRRTFTAAADMMALYKRLHEKNLWAQFLILAITEFQEGNGTGPGSYSSYIPETLAWLFCLSGDGYKERCEMVADFLKEENHDH